MPASNLMTTALSRVLIGGVAAGGVLALSAAGAAAQPRPYSPTGYGFEAPRGAYTSTCRNVEAMNDGYISAECRVGSQYRWSAIRATDCRGDITNRSGVLTCYGATATTTRPAYQTPQQPQQPGGVFGALLGALFPDVFVDDRQLETDWNQGRRIGERRDRLEARLDAGVRDGSLTRAEASRIQAEFDDLVRLEDRYAATGGLSQAERDDLRTRYRALASRIGDERRDGEGRDRDGDNNGRWSDRRWEPVSTREAQFDARLDAAVRGRTLTMNEARRIGAQFDELVRTETRYSGDGLSREERQELETAYRALSARIGDNYDEDRGGDRTPRWIPMTEREAGFDARLDAAVRARTLSMTEARRLGVQFDELMRTETRYSAGGLSAQEREELEVAYTQLERRIDPRWQGDQGGYGGADAGMRSREVEALIASGERNGRLTRTESARLRAELGDLTRLHEAYARDGLNRDEQVYLESRYTQLEQRVREAL